MNINQITRKLNHIDEEIISSGDEARLAKEIYEHRLYNYGSLTFDIEDLNTYSQEDLDDILNSLDSIWYVEDFTIGDLRQLIRDAIQLADDIKDHLYNDYIELSDNRTVYNVDIQNEQDYFIYNDLVNSAANRFKEISSVSIYFLGSGGKHVCVENTYTNALKFNYLCLLQQELEKDVINQANEILYEEHENSDEEF